LIGEAARTDAHVSGFVEVEWFAVFAEGKVVNSKHGPDVADMTRLANI
jgi:hypothetical protein